MRWVLRSGLVVLLALGCAPEPPGSQVREPAMSSRIALSGVSVALEGPAGLHTLKAPRVEYRNRPGASGFATYHTIADLVIAGGQLSISLEEHGGFGSVPRTLDDLAPASGDDIDGDATGLQMELPQVDDARITRLLFESPTILLVTPSGAEAAIQASAGRYDLRSGTLSLDGSVRVRTASGQELRAPSGVLSRDHDGLFFPRGHERYGRRQPGSAWASLDASGEVSTTRVGRPIAYEDLIENLERIVLLHYAEQAPPELRPLMLALLSGLQANASK